MAFDEALTNEQRAELSAVADPLRKSVTKFIAGEVSADEFEAEFLEAFQRTGDTHDRCVGNELDRMFFAVEDYVGHGMTINRDEGDLDAGDLLERARLFAALAGW